MLVNADDFEGAIQLNQLEKTIIDAVTMAIHNITAGVTSVVERSYCEATYQIADSMNMTPEAFTRREVVDQMTTCYAYTDLAKIADSGLSREAINTLLELEVKMIEITNQMTDLPDANSVSAIPVNNHLN